MSTPRRSSGSKRRFDSPQQEVYLSLWRTYDRLRQLEDELFARFELTAQQYNVLRLLRAEHPSCLPTLALAQRLVSRAPDITRMIDKLEQRGLVSRQQRAENRRVVLVGVTEKGLALVRDITAPLRDCHARQLGHLPTEDLHRLNDLLRAARAPHEPEGGTWR
jgi:DNA-binding MarR family transcriptional regulator